MDERNKKEMAEMKLYSRLTGVFYDAEDYGTAFDGGGLYGYRRRILEAVEADWIQESEAGLTEYLGDAALRERIVSLHPSVEGLWCSLWGVLTVKSRGALTDAEVEALKDEWYGQMTDGWGEGFFQEAIDCGEGGRLYVNFGDAGRDGIKTEQELKGNVEDVFLGPSLA